VHGLLGSRRRMTIKLPAKGEHVVLGDITHYVIFSNADYFIIRCVVDYPECYRPRTLLQIVDTPVDCLDCIARDRAKPDAEED